MAPKKYLGGPRDRSPIEMHVLPGTTVARQNDGGFGVDGGIGTDGAFAGGGITASNHRGFGVTDAATGAAGRSLGFGSIDGFGGGGFSVDGRKLLGLGAGQRLSFGVDVDYSGSRTNFDAGSGTMNSSSVGVGFSAAYAIQGSYLVSATHFGWGDGSENLTPGGAAVVTGKWNSDSVATDLAAGHIFAFRGAGFGRGPLLLDASVHGGYIRNVAGGFTDSTGASFGNETESYWTLGGRARLVAPFVHHDALWMPYVGATVDEQLGYTHTVDIPAQGAAAADQLRLTQGNTYWGAEGGVNAVDRHGVTVGASLFYQQSSDASATGGRMAVGVPF